jgi:hypothetical protein
VTNNPPACRPPASTSERCTSAPSATQQARGSPSCALTAAAVAFITAHASASSSTAVTTAACFLICGGARPTSRSLTLAREEEEKEEDREEGFAGEEVDALPPPPRATGECRLVNSWGVVDECTLQHPPISPRRTFSSSLPPRCPVGAWEDRCPLAWTSPRARSQKARRGLTSKLSFADFTCLECQNVDICRFQSIQVSKVERCWSLRTSAE